MQNGNRIVQGLWVGGRLSALERLCIRSFCAHGHEFHLYHYDELQNIPRIGGLRLLNAEDILPRAAIFFHKRGTLAFFADHFRFALLHKRGGWWADMDLVCVRPFDFAEGIVLSRTCRPGRLWNGMLKFPRGHPLVAALADSYSDVNRLQPWDKPLVRYHKIRRRLMFWRDSRLHIGGRDAGGMHSLMSAVRHFGLEEHIQPASVFTLPGDPKGRKVAESAGWNFDGLLAVAPELRCVHLCNSFLSLEGVDKDGDYPADSLYEVLKRRYPEPAQ